MNWRSYCVCVCVCVYVCVCVSVPVWYLKCTGCGICLSFTRTGEGTTRKSLRDVVTEWATTGKRSQRRPRPWNKNKVL